MNLTHYWVNHSLHFANPIEPNIHTNSIEGFWSNLKKSLAIPIKHLDDYINSYLFEKFIFNHDTRYVHILNALSHSISY